jgi:hypothetical protein
MLPRQRTGWLPIFVNPDTLSKGGTEFREPRGPAEFSLA